MSARRGCLPAVAVLAASGALLAGPASAALSPLPVEDVHRSDRIEDVTAFVEPTGDALLVWTGQNNVPTVLASVKPGAAPFGPAQTLSTTPNAQTPSIVRAPDGRLMVAYSTATNTVPDEFVVRPPGGAFGAPQQFPLGDRFVQVAADGAGVATAVWKGHRANGLDFVATSTAPIGSPFVGFDALTPDTDDNFIIPRIAMNASGEAVAAWTRQISPTEDVLEARVRTGGTFGSLQELLRGPNLPRPVVAIDDSGEAIVAWSRDGGGSPVIEASLRAPGSGALSPIQSVAGLGSGPAVAIRDGLLVIGYSGVAGDASIARAIVRLPGRPFGSPVDLSEPSATGESVGVADVGIDASGGALVSWQRETGQARLAEAARRPAGGPFEPPVLIADMTETGRSLAVALRESGDAVAAWRLNESASSAVLLRAGGLRVLPDAATAAADVCAPAPATPPRQGGPARFTLTMGQLAINQRIGQAAVRRLNAIAQWLDAGIETRDLCGGTVGPADLQPGIATAPRSISLSALTPPDPRPVEVATPQRRSVRFTLSPAQLLINQRIYQAAVRRANALQQRLDRGLTGGDLDDGAVTQGKLHDRLRIVSVTPASPVPASTTDVAPARRGNPGAVRLTVGQLGVNQRVAQAGVRRANALLAKLEGGISSADIRDDTVGAGDLAGGALPE